METICWTIISIRSRFWEHQWKSGRKGLENAMQGNEKVYVPGRPEILLVDESKLPAKRRHRIIGYTIIVRTDKSLLNNPLGI